MCRTAPASFHKFSKIRHRISGGIRIKAESFCCRLVDAIPSKAWSVSPVSPDRLPGFRRAASLERIPENFIIS